ncbi:hypothetical protein E2C01_039021 [Portunus trituberculatus]|uniref:Uncharacterized protein n=1 Tax=Portunus trituberculatus TaxID=210409 RepID=A0A5B7FII5_PORTR|nr:hypothetical protein [Portunus trituberculatus]
MEEEQEQALHDGAECIAMRMAGLMDGVMYVMGEDLTNTSEAWTLVGAKKRRREEKKQIRRKGSRYQMNDRSGWRRENDWRIEKPRERPHQRTYTVTQAAVLVESTKHLDDMEDGWAVPPDLQRPTHHPARNAAADHSTDDISGWDAPPQDLGWDVPPEELTGWDL